MQLGPGVSYQTKFDGLVENAAALAAGDGCFDGWPAAIGSVMVEKKI